MKDSQELGIIVIILIIAGVIIYWMISQTFISTEFLESASCEQLMELIKNSDYGVEYHDKWIEGECWKPQTTLEVDGNA